MVVPWPKDEMADKLRIIITKTLKFKFFILCFVFCVLCFHKFGFEIQILPNIN